MRYALRGGLILGLVGVALVVSGCTDIYFPSPTPTGAGGNTFVITQNQGSQNSGAQTGDTPSSSSGIARVKVGFFGGTCPSGPMVPGQTALEQKCEGTMTATPKVKLSDGLERDATELEHGPDDAVVWTADIGADVLVCITSPANGFNRVCAAKKPGPWEQCAVVKGVKGCASGTVT